MKTPEAATRWLAKNWQRLGPDGYPTAEQRQTLLERIKGMGTTVVLLTPQKQLVAGRTVMRSPHGGWACNMGGPHGRPGVADANNIVWVAGAPDLKDES